MQMFQAYWENRLEDIFSFLCTPPMQRKHAAKAAHGAHCGLGKSSLPDTNENEC